MRIGELLNIKLEDYNYELSAFKLTDTKNNEERYVAISDKLNEEINKFVTKFFYNKSNDEYIFKIHGDSATKYLKKY